MNPLWIRIQPVMVSYPERVVDVMFDSREAWFGCALDEPSGESSSQASGQSLSE